MVNAFKPGWQPYPVFHCISRINNIIISYGTLENYFKKVTEGEGIA